MTMLSLVGPFHQSEDRMTDIDQSGALNPQHDMRIVLPGNKILISCG